MIRYRIEALISCLHQCEEMERDLEIKATHLGRTLTDDEKGKLRDLLGCLLEEMGELELLKEESAAGLITGFEDGIGDAVYQTRDAYTELRTRRKYLEDALPARQFMYIPVTKVQHYKDANVLTKRARETFPSAYMELIEAGNCYAAARNDACVFHAMRSLEKPVRALAKALKTKLSKHPDLITWGGILNAVDAKLASLAKTKHTKKRNRMLKFYSEARIEFECFKLAWRNFVVHERETYTDKRAGEILDHTRAFVERLAEEGLKE